MTSVRSNLGGQLSTLYVTIYPRGSDNPARLPPNCSFEIDDFEAEWPYVTPFDYIHGRELAGSIKDIDRLCNQGFDHLRPGGWFELQSFRVELFADDDSLQKTQFTAQCVGLLQEAATKFGKPVANMDEWPAALTRAGFQDVALRIIKVPMSPWPKDPKQKEIGRYMEVEQHQAIPGYANALLSRVLGWSQDEINVLVAHVKSELKDRSIHQYTRLYIVYGRKP